MKLLVGLGNPGKEYAQNRHNVGFMVMDEMASRFSHAPFRKKFSGLIADAMIDGQKAILLKPQTYMNLSGQSVQQAAHFYKIALEDIIVFYDELDLEPGKIKIKQGGGSGGHNGIKSIDSSFGDKEYWRVRIGIGHPGHKNRVTSYVLSDFSKADSIWLDDVIPALAKDASFMLQEGAQSYSNALALRLNA